MKLLEADIEYFRVEVKDQQNIDSSIVIDGSIEWYELSLNYEILETKANFTLGEREDFYERKSNASFKILPTGQNFELVLLFTHCRVHPQSYWVHAE